LGATEIPPLQAFISEALLPDEEIDLAKAALHLAAQEYGELDIVAYMGRISLLAERTRALMPGRPSFYDAVHAINTVLFEQEGIKGNSEAYYDPRNSYLNDVLDRRTGIPITLSVLYMEIGERTGQRFRGIGMPSHFILSAGQGPSEVFIDPFNMGGLLSRKEALSMALRGKEAPKETMAALARRLLPPADKRAILRRMLNNLKQSFGKQNDYSRGARLAECIRALEPEDWRNLSDLARFQTELGRYSDAADSLSAFIERAPAGVDMRLAESALRQLRALAYGKPERDGPKA
jgi:regulator of sirC expression with transglutaminase-like and TPR domain